MPHVVAHVPCVGLRPAPEQGHTWNWAPKDRWEAAGQTGILPEEAASAKVLGHSMKEMSDETELV